MTAEEAHRTREIKETHQNSIFRLVSFRLQLYHVLDKDFCVSSQQGFDAFWNENKEKEISDITVWKER